MRSSERQAVCAVQARINVLVTLFLTLIILVGPGPCWSLLAFLSRSSEHEQRTEKGVCMQQFVLVRLMAHRQTQLLLKVCLKQPFLFLLLRQAVQ